LTAAEATHESPHGRITSAWNLDGNALTLRVVVPSGTEAEVVLPDGQTAVAGPGEHVFTASPTN
ncbi:MAG: alpha-L-rhamnosidase, partial [Pseudonocardiales bacterium]|nr:alpha-L-rhamnosidase [Pseudonocardiales bacterium]